MNRRDILFHYTPAQQNLDKVAEMTRLHEEGGGNRVVLRFNYEGDTTKLVDILTEGADNLYLYKLNSISSNDYFLIGLNRNNDLICLEEAGDDRWIRSNEHRLRNPKSFILTESEGRSRIDWL